MFCSKCGNELKTTDAFCPKCGEAVNGEKSGSTGENALLSHLPGIKHLVDCVPVFIATVVLLIIGLLLVGSNVLQVTLNLQVTATSFELTMFENMGVLWVLFLAGYIAAAVIMVLPLRSGEYWGKGHFALAAIMPVAGTLMLVIVQSVVAGKLDDGSIIEEYLSNTVGMSSSLSFLSGIVDMSEILDLLEPELSMTAFGWLFVIVSVATEVLVLRTAYQVLGAQEYSARQYNERLEQERAEKKKKEVPTQSQPQPKQIPTWQRLEMEREADRKKAAEQEQKR